MTGVVAWFTGLPSSGKSTLAAAVRERLVGEGIACCLLDGDEVRDALRPRPGYSPEARDDFYATLAALAALLAKQGLVALVPATAHAREYRRRARELAPRYLEIYVKTPLEECERRDTKSLFARARSGELRRVPGIDPPYEEPLEPDVVAEGGFSEQAASEATGRIRAALEG